MSEVVLEFNNVSFSYNETANVSNLNVKIEKGDFIELYCPESSVKYFDIVYEDENIIVVNKEGRMHYDTIKHYLP